jgi:hypothetical protein
MIWNCETQKSSANSYIKKIIFIQKWLTKNMWYIGGNIISKKIIKK